MLTGRKLITPYPDIKDDPLQMGGDILLQQNGNFVKKYLSQFPADRPALKSFTDKMQTGS